MRLLVDFPPPEAKNLFIGLEKLAGAKTSLDANRRDKAIRSLASLVNQFNGWRRSKILRSIASTIQLELRKCKEIDEKIIGDVIHAYPNLPGEVPKKIQTLGANAQGVEEDEEVEEPEEEEEEVDDFPEPDEEDFALDLVKIDYAEMEERKAKQKEPTEQDWILLSDVCRKCNCTLKQGDEQKILDMLIPFLSDTFTKFSCLDMDRRICMEGFIGKYVVEYVDSICTLEDLETVDRAIETVRKDLQASACRKKERVSRMLENNTVPTNAEGIHTPVNDFKPEKRECGVECKIASPLNLAEQREICLPTPECGVECEIPPPLNLAEQREIGLTTQECGMECEIVPPINLAEQREFGLTTPEYEDMETEDRFSKTRKRKLEFSPAGIGLMS